MTDKMGTMFECLHRELEDKSVGAVNTDIGADLPHNSPAPHNLSRQWFNDYNISKKKKLKSRMFMSLCYTRD